MTWFALGWTVALAMVVYADAIEGGCRAGLPLLGTPSAGSWRPDLSLVDGIDPSELDGRRWLRRRTGSW